MSTALSVAARDDAQAEWEQRAWQAHIRLRAVARCSAPPRLRLPGFVALAFVVLVHGLLMIALRNAMEPPLPAQVAPVQIRLISETEPPPLPQPAPLPMRAPQRAVHATPPRAIARPPAATPLQIPDNVDISPRVFNPDGSIILPAEAVAPRNAMTATFAEPPPSPDQGIMRHQRPLKVRPNHFAQYFKPQRATALDDFIADHLTFEKEFVLPWGTHVKCAAVVLIIAAGGGCGWETPYPYYVPTAPWKPASVLDEQ